MVILFVCCILPRTQLQKTILLHYIFYYKFLFSNFVVITFYYVIFCGVHWLLGLVINFSAITILLLFSTFSYFDITRPYQHFSSTKDLLLLFLIFLL